MKTNRLLDQYPRAGFVLAGLFLASLFASSVFAQDPIDAAVNALRKAGASGAGFDDAIPAAERLRQLPAEQLPRLLDGVADVNPIAGNWFRGVVFDVARGPTAPSVEMLSGYAMNKSNNATGRGLAMELIRKQDAELSEELIAKCLHDPSLPLREMAVEQAIGNAEALSRQQNTSAAIDLYRESLVAARHPRQLSRIVDALAELGQEVSTADAFALVKPWKSIAPFDNVGGVGFDAVFTPESEFAANGQVDLSAKHEGKDGVVQWQSIDASDDAGVVNLASAYNKEKGAVAYLVTEFESSQARPVEVRLGCINANKVWVNGKEVMATEVYHSGSMLDQYIAKCELKKGTNRVLLKICQNEQTESWAQDWQFQFRLTDLTGKGLRSGQ
jgi:hypothetical protein